MGEGVGSPRNVLRDAPILILSFAQQTKLNLVPQLDRLDALGLAGVGKAAYQEVIRRSRETVQIELLPYKMVGFTQPPPFYIKEQWAVKYPGIK